MLSQAVEINFVVTGPERGNESKFKTALPFLIFVAGEELVELLASEFQFIVCILLDGFLI